MKILELRFKNLNSLYGEWFIDFSDPEYVSNGIFALTGPTGSGKSTILDAICLALYGATPRLGRITKSGNEIMSRQTGECYAEVVFQSQEGRFRCHWAQHRANKKADRPLQESRHEISDAETGKPIETKKSLVSGVIEKNTGMDFDRFTRSILLAQGGFDTFLKADTEQKSKILEQITGTEIYSEISRRVHERQRDEREKLSILQAETSGIVILEPPQEQEIHQQLADKQKLETELASKANKTRDAIAWLTGIDGLQKELASLAEESEELKSELEIFQPNRERLGQAMKAAELDGDFATLTAVRKQQEADQSTLKIEEAKLPELESSASQKQESLKMAEQLTQAAKEQLKIAAPLIRKVHSLDQKLADQRRSVESGEADCRKDEEQIATDKKAKSQVQTKRNAAHSELQLVLEYLETHSRDERLVSSLAGIEEQLGNLLAAQKEIAAKTVSATQAGKAVKAAAKKLESGTHQLNTRKQEANEALKHLEQSRKDLAALLDNRLLREYRVEKDTLLREMAFLKKIAELEDYRTKLEDGKPCPLCGAEKHPYAEGNIPEPDETEKKIDRLTKLIGKAEEQESIIKQLEAAEKEALKNLADSEKIEAAAANEKKAAEIKLADLTEELQKSRSGFDKLKNSALVRLQPLGIETIPDSDVSSVLAALKERLKQWHDRVIKKAEIEKLIAELDSELKRFDAVIETQLKALTKKQASLHNTRQEYAAGRAERLELFADKRPDTEEARLTKAVADSEQAEKKARTEHDEAGQRLNSARVNIASLKDRIEKRSSDLQRLAAEFAGKLQPLGFTDEPQYIQARLTAQERDRLTLKAKTLDNRQTDLLARQKDRDSRLSLEIGKKITESSLDELAPALKELEGELKQLWDLIAGLKHRLTENIAAKERIKEKQALIDAQKKECRRWEKLHALIGSADGKKYRNFAQGLTFELMVAHANRQLVKMTDRYLLIRDNEQPLELNVVDNYQAGEIRSTKNLSGGESFIVSLTLALGLSKMASRKVRVDSLFLDEGFGTLDEDALETALETLSGLQQDGKLIGVISHVSALKERISTQITIVPISGGKSEIIGPGCKKVIQDN